MTWRSSTRFFLLKSVSCIAVLLIICIFHVLTYFFFDKVLDMTETKVDAVLNFARNVFVDTALKVRGQLIVIIVIIMIIIKVSKLIKIVIFLILQCRTILDISSQKILESSTPPQQVDMFQMLSLQMSLVDNDKLIRHGSPHQCWSSSVAPCNSSTEGGRSFFSLVDPTIESKW